LEEEKVGREMDEPVKKVPIYFSVQPHIKQSDHGIPHTLWSRIIYVAV
jgi:hypothetical protein